MNGITIGYAGMTHLGLNYAIAGAGKGFKVIGFDLDPTVIVTLNAGKLPVVEPGLLEAMHERTQQLEFTNEIIRLASCDVVYIAPDVVTDDRGQSDLTYITGLINQVAQVMNEQAILVVLAQVPPGFTRRLGLPLERLYYQVETLIFGKALERAEHPERLIIGCAQPEFGLAPALQEYLGAFGCPILPMRYESAELAKIAINCCLVASISVANTLGEICEHIGADWGEIVPALRLDQRIGQYAYLQPGLGLAGGNLERDLATVINLADHNGTDKGVISALVNNSKHRRNWPLKMLHQKVFSVKPDAQIAVLGLAYKENTHSIKNSPAIKLLQDIKGFVVRAFDPVVKKVQTEITAHVVDSALAAANDADALVIMTPWAEFRELDVAQLAKVMRTKVIIDPFKVLYKKSWSENGFAYYTLGC